MSVHGVLSSSEAALVDDLEGRLTAARAGYLDNLSAGAVALQSAVDDLETRLTAARAGYLDNLSAGAVAQAAQVLKIDGAATAGMLATVDSLAYHMHVTRRAVNHYERWYAKAAAADAEIHVADNIGNTGTAAFQIDGGAVAPAAHGVDGRRFSAPVIPPSSGKRPTPNTTCTRYSSSRQRKTTTSISCSLASAPPARQPWQPGPTAKWCSRPARTTLRKPSTWCARGG